MRKVSIIVLALVLVFSSVGLNVAYAATTPSLGAAATYGVLSSTFTNTNPTTINGDVGFTTGPGALGDIAGHPSGTYPNYGPGGTYAAAGIDQGSALTALNGQSCTFSFAPGAIDLATDATHGPIGIYTPGVYCTTTAAGAMSIGASGITLSGAGTYIFRTSGPSNALTTVVGSSVTLAGASACDVFWTPTAATTLAATTTFSGTVIDDAGITVGASTTWTGRALSFGGTVTTDTDTITVPNCAPPELIVTKVVVNTGGGTNGIADFPLFIDGGSVISGFSNVTSAGSHTVSETSNASYTSVIGGDCAANGSITLAPGDLKLCTITNTYVPPPSGGGGGRGGPTVVPPLIDVVKVPSPLSLPGGPGPVTYTYTLRNIGTVPVNNITMVGDSCSPIGFVSGDTNSDAKLDVNETWIYRCSTTLSATHTNTVTATGWANGISAIDIASATVVVGVPVNPPLIHVTKVPNPLTLSAGGGMVTYTNKVTNPGTVALSNVRLTDDKCGPVNYISGDTNGDSKLDLGETWVYTCQTSLTRTTTNTVTAKGDANGITASDFAIATVVVAFPGLPRTGFPPASTLGEQVKTIVSTLRRGSNGGNVITLQRFLISENKGSKALELKKFGADGKFGLITKAALAEWQTFNGLVGDGVFGSKTRAYISAHL